MKFSQAKHGRVFIIRLEDGEVVHEEIERFAKEQSIKAAALIAVGGIDKESKLIVGPENGRKYPITPMELLLDDVHEVVGTGTLFPDEDGHPLLHMHMSCGRESSTTTGCIRNGVKVWRILEIVLFEFIDTRGRRELDEKTGFKFLKL